MKGGGMIVYIRYIGDDSILATLSSGFVAITWLEGGTAGVKKTELLQVTTNYSRLQPRIIIQTNTTRETKKY